MNKKRKLFLFISGVIFCLGLLFAVKFMMDAPYRNQLPAYPDINTISKPVQEQLSQACGMAYWYTTANTLGALGMVYHSCAQYEKAADCYQLAVKKNSTKYIWSYYLGYLNLEQGEPAEAIRNFRQVLEHDPKNYLALYYTGEAYQKLGLNDKAEPLFKQVSAATGAGFDETNSSRENYFPLRTYSLFQLARIYIQSDHPDSAESTLKKIIADQTGFGPAYRALGNVYILTGDSSLASKYSIRANDLADYTAPADSLADRIALLSRSDQYLPKRIDDAVRSGNFHWAFTLCNQAMKYFPDNKYVLSRAVFENFRQGFDEKALSYLDKHLSYYSDDGKELMDVTDLLYDKGHPVEAMMYFNQVKKILPDNSSLATWLYDRGRKEEAVVMMNGLVKRKPGNEKILGDAIRMLLNMGDDELAKEYFTRLTQASPSGAEALKITGLIMERAGDLKGALPVYEKAFQLDPEDLIFEKELIDAYIRNKNWDGAISHFRQALEIYPNEPFLLEGFGRLLIACPNSAFKNIKEGLEYTERAFISFKSPNQTKLSAGKTLATVYVAAGDKKNATTFINKTITLAKEGKMAEEYISYFKTLVSKQ